jgi:hypothetical protein
MKRVVVTRERGEGDEVGLGEGAPPGQPLGAQRQVFEVLELQAVRSIDVTTQLSCTN